jgi:hypothetical protein
LSDRAEAVLIAILNVPFSSFNRSSQDGFDFSPDFPVASSLESKVMEVDMNSSTDFDR